MGIPLTQVAAISCGAADAARTLQVCKKRGGSEQTYYRWRREYGGLRLDQAKRLKEFESERTCG